MKVTTALLAGLSVTRTVSAWSITWYSNDDCGGVADYTGSFYEGHGSTSDCIQPGQPGSDPSLLFCVWDTVVGGHYTAGECTAPTVPVPRSFWLDPGTKCHMSGFTGCGSPTKTYGKSHVGICNSVDGVPNFDDMVTFWCQDEDN